jgi:hypothetical protein
MERRRPIPILPIPSMPQRPQRSNCETEKRLRALKTGSLKINGNAYETNINGTNTKHYLYVYINFSSILNLMPNIYRFRISKRIREWNEWTCS